MPLHISRYSWDLEEGTITATDTGRRVAILGPLALEAIMDDLEAAHGKVVIEAAIEAQRSYVHTKVTGEELRSLVYSLQGLTALRGLGNVTRFDADKERVSITIENSCMHLVVVGMAQALYELALNRDDSTRAMGAVRRRRPLSDHLPLGRTESQARPGGHARKPATVVICEAPQAPW